MIKIFLLYIGLIQTFLTLWFSKFVGGNKNKLKKKNVISFNFLCVSVLVELQIKACFRVFYSTLPHCICIVLLQFSIGKESREGICYIHSCFILFYFPSLLDMFMGIT